jgi:Zn-dependent protease with chaperone function
MADYRAEAQWLAEHCNSAGRDTRVADSHGFSAERPAQPDVAESAALLRLREDNGIRRHDREIIMTALKWLLLGLMVLSADLARAGTRLYLVEALAEDGAQAPLRAQARELEAIYADLSAQAGIEPLLVWSDDPEINAFATELDGRKIILVQDGLLTRFGGDRDAVAAVLGHELAHHQADHVRAGRNKQEGIRVLGAILGAVVGAKVGRNSGDLAGAAAGAAVGVGADLLALKFSRHQELEADRLAVRWMVRAGYNPAGMLRLQSSLGEMAGDTKRASILSTHPNSKKRYKAAEKTIAGLQADPELLSRAVQPLTDADDLAAADEAIRLDVADALVALQAANADAAALQAKPASTPDATDAASAEAAASGVHIGNNVKIGKGVRIGGKPVPPREADN